MKQTFVSFYPDFHCTASECSDSCCIGWEIDIDSNTAEYYRSCKGDFAEKLHSHISEEDGPHFILTEKERCPFLNEKNLCEIFIHLGEEHLCEICTQHPRFHEWFGDYKESGLGLCCEEAVRLLFADPKPLTFITKETDEAADDIDFDEELFAALLKVREKLFAMLQNRSLPLGERMASLLNTAVLIQDAIDNENLDEILNLEAASLKTEANKEEAEEAIINILSFMEGLEPIDESWPEYLKELKKEIPNLLTVKTEVPSYEYEHLCVYFLFRYFLKGVFDGDVLSRAKLAVFAPVMICLMGKKKFHKTGELSLWDRINDTKAFSKEMEYSEENLEALLCESWENPALSVEAICKMAEVLL